MTPVNLQHKGREDADIVAHITKVIKAKSDYTVEKRSSEGGDVTLD